VLTNGQVYIYTAAKKEGLVTKRLILITVLGAIGLLLASGARADTIGSVSLTACSGGNLGCPAATYSFDITKTSATLMISITGAPGSTNDFITAVDLGFTSSSNTISGLNLTQTPSSGWTSFSGSLSSGGTCGANSGGFVCASASPLNSLYIVQGGVYTWKWTYNALPSIFTDSVHVGAEYGPNQGNYKGLIITEVVPIPEPSSLLLFGTGLLALAAGFLVKKALA